jgi:predicted RNA-binding Zn-ribbon protein involved in translation (DUF1610 family)
MRAIFIEAFEIMMAVRQPKKWQCPNCGRAAMMRRCVTCQSHGKLRFAARGQWSLQDLQKNPFLPYYKSPPLSVTSNDCSKCNGAGQIVVCSICGEFPARKRPQRIP